MPRTPNVDKNGMRKGPWSKEEDDKLRAYIQRYGHWNWREIPRFAGVSRCGKSCRLRWMNYLRPNMKHGNFTKEEEDLIMELHNKIGNKWARIAAELPGRSDNEIKNYWHTHLKKRAKKDQNVLKNVNDENLDTNQANPINNSTENLDLGGIDEVEALWASLSSEISFEDSPNYTYVASSSESLSASSYSSSTVESSMFSASDSLVSSGDSIQRYDDESEANFWTDLFLAADDDSSDSDLINSLMAPASCQDTTIGDELLWSTMDFYSGYHRQFMN